MFSHLSPAVDYLLSAKILLAQANSYDAAATSVSRMNLELPHCPCFDAVDFASVVDNILGHTHDFYPRNCEKIFFNNDQAYSLELFLMEMEPLVNIHPDAIGYGAFVDEVNSENTCTEYDMISFIERPQAEACVDIITEGCNMMRSKTCPCFNYQELLKPITSVDFDRSCKTMNTNGESFGIYNADADMMQYGVETNVLGKQCMIDTGNGLNIEFLNDEQYTFCMTVLERRCSKLENEKPPTCSDAKQFRYRREVRNWCKWAGQKNTNKRCRKRKIAKNCPITCFGQCP